MAQQPAVVIIARHGMRLDAADSSWHFSTPTPYDPPLTYGGWNQCRTLGGRIATLLQRREEQALKGEQHGVTSQDFGQLDGSKAGGEEERPTKKRRIKHKVVIHSSPFLRCLQTSVAIAAGMAQYQPTIESAGQGKKTASTMHSASPRLRATEGGPHASSHLPAISEPKHTDFAHTIARKVALQHEHKRHRKSRLRVDAFLGEWLNPSYFESITHPPPSSMMLATAKAELMQNEAVEILTPAASTKTSNSSLWGSGANGSRPRTPDDSDIPDRPPTPTSPSRSRASTVQSSTATSSSIHTKSPFHPDALTSTLPKPESAIYHPPQPHYAVSASSQIPRGYVAHARNACTNPDYAWDSSRPPQDWGDGGEFGEEWSHMHKRIRRGLNNMIRWYSRHDAEDRAEDALGLEQAEHNSRHGHEHEEEEREDLVIILVTHGAGCNALIGALTGQPVLLDVGMASLTMAVRREDAPPTPVYAAETEPGGTRSESPEMVMHHAGRRGSLDMGLNQVYEMKLVASSDHLRPSGTASPSMRPVDSRDGLSIRHRFLEPQPRSNTSSAIGSIRRPSATTLGPPAGSSADRSSSMPAAERLPSTGLWAPPSGGRSPFLRPQAEERTGLFSSLSEVTSSADTSERGDGEVEDGMQLLDFSTSPPDSRPTSRGGDTNQPKKEVPPPVETVNGTTPKGQVDGAKAQMDGSNDEKLNGDQVTELRESRGRSQRGLWGSKPTATGQTVVRKAREMPKRRWTVDQD